MRFALIALLSLGVVGGFGSAIGRAAYWRHHGGGCHSQYADGADRYGQWPPSRFDSPQREQAPSVAPAAAPAAQTVVVQSPPPAQAPAPVYIIVPSGGAPQQQVITLPQGAVQLLQPTAQPQPAPRAVEAPATSPAK